MTSRTRALPILCVAAIASRWSCALRPGGIAFASSSARPRAAAPGARRTGDRSQSPCRGSAIQPTIIRIVVDFPGAVRAEEPGDLPGCTVNETSSTAVFDP